LYRGYYIWGGTYSGGLLDKAILILWSETENNYLRGPTDLCREPDISEIRKERLRKSGHMERTPEERTVMKVFLRISQKERRPLQSHEEMIGRI